MELTVFTLNCWGIAGISKDRKQRMRAIAEKLSTSQYDFVFLQEVWVEEDYEMIAEKCRSAFPFSHYFHSGVIGAGVCVFSVSPIIEVFFHTWPVNGYIHKIHHGDWWSGKGVGVCTVAHKGYSINLYITHLHAEYNRENDEYCVHRVTQAYETAQLIAYTRHGADICILAGDLNTEPGDLPYRLICQVAGLEDSFASTRQVGGMTSETPSNSYTAKSSLSKCPDGKRIDYIMYLCRNGLQIKTLHSGNPLSSRVEGFPFSFSDHEAVCSKLHVSTSDASHSPSDTGMESLKEAHELCEKALYKLARDRLVYWFLFASFLVLLCSLPDIHEYWVVHYLIVLLRLILVLAGTYSLIMATIWNRIERHGIKSGKLAIKTRLELLTNKYVHRTAVPHRM